ncbi:hypothetical protein AB0J28_16875 [Streptosporangium canum]|uniref:hypothetical protein n=1 Tax=Streptosporangium canum TaxID=324952 RepID=UPI0034168DC1
MMERKEFTPVIRGVTGEGKVTIVVASLNAVDHDGDVTLPGFFGKQTAQIVPAHDWNHVPLGRALITESGAEAIAELQFNLKVPAAVDWFEAIKFDHENPPALQEYSYGFNILDGGARIGEHHGRRVRFLQPLKNGQPGVRVVEVSPVMLGAGIATRTLAVKRKSDDLDAQARDQLQRLHLKMIHEQLERDIEREYGRAALMEAAQHLMSWYVDVDEADVSTSKKTVAEAAIIDACIDLKHSPIPALRWFRPEARVEADYLEIYGEPAERGFGWLSERLLGKAHPHQNVMWLNVEMHDPADVHAIASHEVAHLAGADEDTAQAYEGKARADYYRKANR